MKIELIEYAGFESAFKAMRLPKKSINDSKYASIHDKNFHGPIIGSYDYNEEMWGYRIGKKDLKLAQTLILAGDEHAKAIRGIQVWLELTAPWYWFNELDTYCVGTSPLGSTSTMHVDAKGLTGEVLQAFKGAIRGDYEYTRIRTFNYQCLRRIYFQRRYHRLPEWKYFCDFINTLPLSNELICLEKSK